MSIELYPGIAFSPQAALADNIGAADTIVKVTDVSAFPDAPNLATIGTDEEGETILYAAKTADALSGCVRGVEGTAKPWSAGEGIGRNWTAKDHTDLIAAVLEAQGTAAGAQSAAETAQAAAESAARAANAASEALSTKQDKLTGTPGQVVGFSADGTAAAVQGWNNRDLLDNSHFTDAINQRGKTKYTAAGYTIDRWYANRITVSLSKSGIVLSNPTMLSGTWGGYISQRFEKSRIVDGSTVTVSFIANEILYSQTFHNINPSMQAESFYTSSDGKVAFMFANFSNYYACSIYNQMPESSITVKAAKLELGTQQTLAHQDASGNWVLNDSPPNKALELAKCQRMQEYIHNIKEETNVARYAVFIPWKIQKRATPSVKIYSQKRTEGKISYWTSTGTWEEVDAKVTAAGIDGVYVETRLPIDLSVVNYSVLGDSNL